MLTSYFKVLLRNVGKNKFFSILNMSGLAIGMTCYLLIFQYVSFELSYDGFHENDSNIYRLQRDVYRDNELNRSSALTSFNVGPAMEKEFPEVILAARCAKFTNNTVSYEDRTFRDENIYVGESKLFNVFSFRFLQGDPETALSEPNQVVVSQSIAKKYFDTENVLGKRIRIENKRGAFSCMISGVLEDIPENSHLKFNMMISLKSAFGPSFSDWVYSTVHTYLLLTPAGDPNALAEKFPDFIQKYIIQHVPLASGFEFILQPLREIYLYSNISDDTENGNGESVYFLLIIAILILVISWINYVNLSTARAMERAREVGIRKVMGGHRLQLIKQFLLESLLVNIIPVSIAIILFFLFIPSIRELVGKNISLNMFGDSLFWLNVLLLYTVGSLLSGLYPAFVLSGHRPVSVLNRSKFSQTTGGTRLRKILVTFQFAASVVLIILTYTVYKQLNYMKNTDLGIDLDHIAAVPLPSTPLNSAYIKNANSFKTELSRYTSIKSIAGSGYVPGSQPRFQRLTWKQGQDFKTGKIQSILFVDYDFLPTYRLEFLAGRNFSKEYGTDKAAVVVNEEALRLLGYESPETALDKGVEIWNLPGIWKIVGVVKNYYHQSLKKKYDPIIFIMNTTFKNYYSLKLEPSDIKGALRVIGEKWGGHFPGVPFDYFFLDEHFERQYQADNLFGDVLGGFVLLSIVITCLGLLGLSAFSTQQRTKEIGIRKSFGAETNDILRLLTGDIVKLVAVAAAAAWPIAYYLGDSWLKNYVSRIGIPWFFFIVSGVLITGIALLTVGYHSIKAARSNPVDSLREE